MKSESGRGDVFEKSGACLTVPGNGADIGKSAKFLIL